MRNLSISLGIVFLALAAPITTAWLLLNYFKTLESELNLVEAQIVVLESKEKNIKSLKDLLEDTYEEKKRIDNTFVDEKGIVRFIEDLEIIAEKNEIKLDIQSIQPVRDPSELGPLFRLHGSGKFENLFRYLFSLENMSYQIISDEIRFQKNAGQNSDWSATYNVRVISYIF